MSANAQDDRGFLGGLVAAQPRGVACPLMSDVAQTPWPEPALNGDEAATWFGSLERQRATFAWKVSGLDSAGLNARLGTSTMTLGGLIKHLAFVEDAKTGEFLTGVWAGPWDWARVSQDQESLWTSAAEDSPEELIALWQGAVMRSRAAFSVASADGSLGAPTLVSFEGEPVSIRRLLADLLEEYARHTGHADLLREAVDGLVGEDPSDGTPAAWPPLESH